MKNGSTSDFLDEINMIFELLSLLLKTDSSVL